MPFWWNRRRRPWYPAWRKRRYRTRKYRKYQRRRRPRRFARRRRRRRRRYKVRKKKQKITLQQWQPDRIVKCKIIGFNYLVCGSEGNQYRCYTDDKHDYGQPKAPGGGGFGCEQFTLEYLYKEWEAHRNVWTASNDYLDLVRYTGCTFLFYRHATTDFVLFYDRQPPFKFITSTYTETHPLQILLRKKHKIIRSLKYAQRQKPYVKVKIKPPKQMITKWFFQPDFANVELLKLAGSAANFEYSLYGPNTQSPCLTLYCLNTDFYQIHNWANITAQTQPYLPYTGIPHSTTHFLTFYYGTKTTTSSDINNYADSTSFDKGWFKPGILQAWKVVDSQQSTKIHTRPISICRYNPEEDNGKGNRIWLTSIFTNKAWAPPTDEDLVIGELPLYLAFWGLWDTIIKKKKTDEFLKISMFVIKSDFIKPIFAGTKQTVWPIIDQSFIQGKMPWDEFFTVQEKATWYPTCLKQAQTINAFVECGPYCPKYSNLPSSTWQLSYKYKFYFKWGGPQTGDKLIQDPKDQEKYPVPDTYTEAIQISDPLRQHPKALLRSWDFRRGIVTASALKRMRENLSTDESDQSDFSETPTKKKKVTTQIQASDEETKEIQACLHSLCEKDSFQESETDIKQLIYKQYQQQQSLKLNLFKLLKNLKKTQAHLQMQTGMH
nr:MAG: ORF1 [Torque teno midi virus]